MLLEIQFLKSEQAARKTHRSLFHCFSSGFCHTRWMKSYISWKTLSKHDEIVKLFLISAQPDAHMCSGNYNFGNLQDGNVVRSKEPKPPRLYTYPRHVLLLQRAQPDTHIEFLFLFFLMQVDEGKAEERNSKIMTSAAWR